MPGRPLAADGVARWPLGPNRPHLARAMGPGCRVRSVRTRTRFASGDADVGDSNLLKEVRRSHRARRVRGEPGPELWVVERATEARRRLPDRVVQEDAAAGDPAVKL